MFSSSIIITLLAPEGAGKVGLGVRWRKGMSGGWVGGEGDGWRDREREERDVEREIGAGD